MAKTSTNDVLTRLGTPVLASISLDIADVESKVDDIETKTNNLPANTTTELTDIKNKFAVPTVDSALDTTVSEVVGTKSDSAFSDGSSTPSVIGHLQANYLHVHSPSKVYPTLADAVTITAHNDAWTLGNKIEIVPADTIVSKFDIHWIILQAISNADEYELVLWKGGAGAEIEIGRIAFSRTGNFDRSTNLPVQVAPVDANTRISASLACKSVGEYTVGVKLYYHTY